MSDKEETLWLWAFVAVMLIGGVIYSLKSPNSDWNVRKRLDAAEEKLKKLEERH